ncbi:MAG: hypothetical protein AAF267_01405 [Deinococcota bacterium]
MSNEYKELQKILNEIEKDLNACIKDLTAPNLAMLATGKQHFERLQRTHSDTLVNLEVRCVRGDAPDYLGAWINAHPNEYLRQRLRYVAYYIKNHDGARDDL